jgi:hypothetical protein
MFVFWANIRGWQKKTNNNPPMTPEIKVKICKLDLDIHQSDNYSNEF